MKISKDDPRSTYKDQFRPMIKHIDCVLTLSSENDELFAAKYLAAVSVNIFLESLTDQNFDSFDM